jgi:transcriptional regulator with XRE-family HTH domain
MRYLRKKGLNGPTCRVDSRKPKRHDVRVAERDLKRLASAVLAARERLGVTQAEFAARSDDLSLPTVQRIEAGSVKRPRAKTFRGLDEAAGWTAGSARAVLEAGRSPIVKGEPESTDEIYAHEFRDDTEVEIWNFGAENGVPEAARWGRIVKRRQRIQAERSLPQTGR